MNTNLVNVVPNDDDRLNRSIEPAPVYNHYSPGDEWYDDKPDFDSIEDDFDFDDDEGFTGFEGDGDGS